MTMPPFTQLELFNRGVKSMKVNINIFPCEHNHQIWIIFESVLKTRLRNRFLHRTCLMHLEDVLQKEWYKILLDTVQNLYEFIPRRTLIRKLYPTNLQK
jgi:hypothetical protein